MKPLHNFCLIKPEEAEKVSSGGIVLPDNAEREKPVKGLVIEVGDMVTKLHKGDNVLFKRYAPYEVNEGEERLLMVEEYDVLAIL